MPALGLLKFINIQGWIGLGVSLVLGFMLIGAKIDARHWHKQSDRYEKLYKDEAMAHIKTVNNYNTAAEKARAADAANKKRVESLQGTINEERSSVYSARIAAARLHAAAASGDPSGSRGAAMPSVPSAATVANGAASEDGFSTQDRLIATEQAIQLDELIKWVKAQVGIDVGNNR